MTDKSYNYKKEGGHHMILCTGHQILMTNIAKARNCYLYDSDNKKYIDFESVAIEFEGEANNVLAATIQQRLLSNGFIVPSRPGFNVIRIDPPLTVSKKDIDSFIENFLQVLNGLI
jgi:4-aminobutyrate aminotransferase-like enzyme